MPRHTRPAAALSLVAGCALLGCTRDVNDRLELGADIQVPALQAQPRELPAADERRRVRVLAGLQHARHRLGSRRVRERGELVEVGLLDPPADADEHRLLRHTRPPRRGERRLERGALVDPAGSLASVLGHRLGYASVRPRRSIASASRSSGTVSEKRT